MTTDEFLPQCRVTPEMFWQFRRQQLGGKSAVTGDELPNTLAKCNAAVQVDHYAQACYAMASYAIATSRHAGVVVDDLDPVPVPPGVSEREAIEIRRRAIEQTLIDHGVG